jgi:hypothetical protein
MLRLAWALPSRPGPASTPIGALEAHAIAIRRLLFRVTALYVESEQHADTLPGEWRSRVEEPARRAGRKAPQLAVVKSPDHFVVGPIIDFILDVERHHPQRTIAVVLPQLVQRRWYHYFLHNHYGELMAALLLLKGERRVVVVDVPWYIGH